MAEDVNLVIINSMRLDIKYLEKSLYVERVKNLMSEPWGSHHLEVEEGEGTSKETDKCGREIQNCEVLESKQ